MNVNEIIIPLMESRTQFYRMLHNLYRRPLSEEDYAALDAEAFKALADGAGPDGGLMADGFNDMYRYLRRSNTGTRQTLNMDYTKVFLGTSTYDGFSALPYASLYTGRDNRLMGAERNAVNAIYRKYGVKLGKGIDLPEDHLAFECEFLAIINERATAAMASGDFPAAAELLQVEKDFVEAHILNWYGRFFNLANKMLDTRFYRGVMKIAKAYFADEPGTLGDLIATMGEDDLTLEPVAATAFAEATEAAADYSTVGGEEIGE